MNKSNYLIALGISAAAGALAGILSSRKNPGLGGLFGAAAGAAVGVVTVSACKRLREKADDGVDYYSEISPLYQDFDDIEVE
jgi:hypothetical protein